MLRHEHRVPAHRRLPPVIRRLGRCEPFGDEIASVGPDYVDSALVEVPAVLETELEARAERRPRKLVEHAVEIAHRAC